uniref:Uncharacterized protein n=1 Tax=Anguilla anguilla TaxID=7936 RepID=A0A0E9T5Y7_ANGAN
MINITNFADAHPGQSTLYCTWYTFV